MAKYRSQRRDARRREWNTQAPDDFEEPSFFSRPPEATEPKIDAAIGATVLWFDPAKGFGFVQSEDGAKAFLHARQLEAAGASTIGEGAELQVVLQEGAKGPSVASIAAIRSTGKGAARPDADRFPSGSEALEETRGVVRFFNVEKGFGFIGREDGGKDIFVHVSALRGTGLTELQEGQELLVGYVQGAKGPEAKSIRPA